MAMLRRRGERPGRRLTPLTSTRVRVLLQLFTRLVLILLSSSQASPPRHWYLEQGYGHLELVRQ